MNRKRLAVTTMVVAGLAAGVLACGGYYYIQENPIPTPMITTPGEDAWIQGGTTVTAACTCGVDWDRRMPDNSLWADELHFNWSFGGTGASAQWNVPATPGPATLTVTADDAPHYYNDESVTSATRHVTIFTYAAGAPISVSLSSPTDGQMIRVGTPITISGLASDSDERLPDHATYSDTVNTEVTAGGGEVSVTNSSGSFSGTYTENEPCWLTFTAVADDEPVYYDDSEESTSVEVMVYDYDTYLQIPPPTISSPEDGAFLPVSTQVQVSCDAVQDIDIRVPDDYELTDSVTCTWHSSPSGTFDPETGTSVTWTRDPAAPGEVTISVTADDTPLYADDPASTSDPVTFTLVAVNKIQYETDPDTWVDAPTGTGECMYVLKGTPVKFKALPAPSGASWPDGKLAWGGTAGASGDGPTENVTFITLSSSSTDYKTVTANCGNDVTVNVIVFEATLESVTFGGTGKHTLYKADSGPWNWYAELYGTDYQVAVPNEAWVKSTGLADPVCYTMGASGAACTATVMFSIDPPLDGSAQIWVEGYDSNVDQIFVQSNATITGSSATVGPMNLVDCLCNDAVNSEDWAIDWLVGSSLGEGYPPPKTHNSRFLTYGTPNGSVPTASRMYWATYCAGPWNYAGVEDPGTRLASDDIPLNLSWAARFQVPPHFQKNTAPTSTWAILDPGETGVCVHFALLMKAAMNMVGVLTDATEFTSVTAHCVPVTTWLGETVSYNVLRRFYTIGGTDSWVNEGVCGVDVTDQQSRIYYDVAGSLFYGPRLGPDVGAFAPTQPPWLTENMWREPNGGHGPVMWVWDWRYSNWISTALPNQVKVTYPNGAENISIGSDVEITFLTAGLQTREMKVYHCKDGNNTCIGAVTVGSAQTEAGNFSKENSITWHTSGLEAGNYTIKACLDDISQTQSAWRDESDAAFTLGN